MTDVRKSTLQEATPQTLASQSSPLSRRPVRFLLASGVAAAANFFSRFLFSLWVTYTAAVALAFFVGLSSAFLLNRYFVFSDATNRIHEQLFWFVAVNLVALAQTLLVTLGLADYALPYLGIHWYAEAIAHAAGILTPVFTSYLAHQRLSFRNSASPNF